MSKPQSLDERIAAALREAHESGELQRAEGWGKRLDFGDGYDEAPADLRVGYKILKDAGVAPIEVEMMREVKALEQQLSQLAAQSEEADALRRRISDLRLEVALRMEALAKRARG